MAFSILRDEDDAFDVVSAAFSRWVENPSRYNDKYRISDLAWFIITVKNAARDAWDRMKNARNRDRTYFAEIIRESAMESKSEMLDTMYEAMNRLDEQDREVLHIYLSWQAPPPLHRAGARLGRELGLSDKTATARLRRALLALERAVHDVRRDRDGDDAQSGKGW